MVNIIKTAIITILISFISGLLLEYYKNLAPRLLCNIKNAMPIKISNRQIRAYIVTVSNVSNKTIHDLTLYIQSPHTSLRIADAKITKGLKFDSSIEDNTIDVYIPFLSKDDKFSVTVYAENQYEMFDKPTIIIRSPENFKQIDSLEQNGMLTLLLNIPKNIYEAISKPKRKQEALISNRKDDFTMVMDKVPDHEETMDKYNRKRLDRTKRPTNVKKAIIAIVSVVFIISVGVLGKSYLKDAATKASTPDVKSIIPNESNNGTSASGTNKNTGSKSSTKRTNGNSKAPSGKTDENTNLKTSTDETKANTDSKTSNGELKGDTDSKASTGETKANIDSKTSTVGTNGNTDSKASTGETKANTDSKSSTSGTNMNTDSKTSNEGTSGNTNSKTSTDGTKVNTGN